MKFLKKIDHLKLLQFALGVAIFSVGYLITMFYFQMKDLKEYKHKIASYNELKLEVSSLNFNLTTDRYYVESSFLNQNINANQVKNSANFSNSLFLKNDSINPIDEQTKKNNSQINDLLNRYQNITNQLLKSGSIYKVKNFNSVVKELEIAINSQIIYLQKQINRYNQNFDVRIDNAKMSGFLIALISLVIFVLAYVKMNEDLFNLKRTNDEIVFINETLNNAEKIAGFGSWKINTVENKYIYSDNFYRLIGEKPKSFKGSLEGILEFIHPDDREMVRNSHIESLKTHESTKLIYRYLLKDGTIKNIVTVGKFLHNSKGELVKIGVNQDVTEILRKSTELEEKNSRLIAINSELESFNNIVGHDLQEPLRKMQMFISRIESKEFLETASGATVGYFEKIKLAAQRMSNLMTDLVNYSRTVKAERIFEEVDLNEIFVEITEDLSLIIEENSATVNFGVLPIVVGTRFQIQQLFINLVSNSLKYVKPDVSPIIDIRLENFDKDLIEGKLISSSNYYKITVSDNGIGFDQKHADKIFMLFQRLETDAIYKGTGLGLAICKKIVDNNNGMITAAGMPSSGAVFTVYLPRKSK